MPVRPTEIHAPAAHTDASAVVFDNIGIITSIITFILLFIRSGEGDK